MDLRLAPEMHPFVYARSFASAKSQRNAKKRLRCVLLVVNITYCTFWRDTRKCFGMKTVCWQSPLSDTTNDYIQRCSFCFKRIDIDIIQRCDGLLCRIEQETSCANHVERIDSQPIKAEELAPKHCQDNER